MRALLLLALVSCAEVDIASQAAGGPGTVYNCTGDDQEHELCFYDDAAEELAWHLGLPECHAVEAGERFWPWLTNLLSVGCTYVCPGQRGCNAHQGCYCEGA